MAIAAGLRVVSLAVRAAARAGLSVDRDRGGACRSQGRGRAARARAEPAVHRELFAIFILLGLGATAIGSTLNDHRETLEQIGGVLIVLMGVVFLADSVRRSAQLRMALGVAAADWPVAAARCWRARRSRSPGLRVRASPWERSSPRRRSLPPPPTARCCSRSTRQGWRSHFW